MWFDKGPIDHEPLVPGPADFGYTNTWSMHYVGQLLIDHEGDYAVTVDHGRDTDDVSRVFVDGTLVASSKWNGLDDQELPAHLAAGWHALAFDHGQNIGGAQLHLRIAEAGGTPEPIGTDHLRPAIARNAPTPIYTQANVAAPWADTVPAVATLATAATDGRVIDSLDVMYILATANRGGLTATLEMGGERDPVAIRETANETNIATAPYDYDAVRPAFVGMLVQSPWTSP